MFVLSFIGKVCVCVCVNGEKNISVYMVLGGLVSQQKQQSTLKYMHALSFLHTVIYTCPFHCDKAICYVFLNTVAPLLTASRLVQAMYIWLVRACSVPVFVHRDVWPMASS